MLEIKSEVESIQLQKNNNSVDNHTLHTVDTEAYIVYIECASGSQQGRAEGDP